ncbi:MAG TPA: GNAT family N-acetyltransferase [Anaerolineae bacterium]|nr:GNAT family N-acetyltransferase [Anaerolineae bacterium]
MEINIRPAQKTDYTQICLLFQQVDHLHAQNLSHIFAPPTPEAPSAPPARSLQFINQLITDTDAALFVADDNNNQLLGLIHLNITPSPTNPPIFVERQYAVINTLVVHHDYQNLGLGHRLMQTAHHWATQKNITHIELNVYAFNTTALNFYQKLGYQPLSHKLTISLT